MRAPVVIPGAVLAIAALAAADPKPRAVDIKPFSRAPPRIERAQYRDS
jgi:hypothetical protein